MHFGTARDPPRGYAGRMGVLRRSLEYLDDAATLAVIVLSVPVVILLIGTPVALFVRLLLEIGRRL